MGPSTHQHSPARRAWLADAYLLSAALIWGSGFAAQRVISEHLGPLTFNIARNLIGLATLAPWFWLRRRSTKVNAGSAGRGREQVLAGLATGSVLFAGSWLQQAGIAQTTAGNAGFITGLYVVLVPLLAALAGARPGNASWFAALLATAGMYLLGATETWSLGRGDLLVLGSAFFWAIHVHAVAHFARRIDGVTLVALQLGVATALLIPCAMGLETVRVADLQAVTWPLLYSGIICCALGFALQIAGQRDAPSAHAAVLMSLESVFAAFFGWIFLGEKLGPRGFLGATLMFAGMLVSQWPTLARSRAPRSSPNDVSRGS